METIDGFSQFVITCITIIVIVTIIGLVYNIFMSVNEKVLNTSAEVTEIPVKVVEKRTQIENGSERHYNIFKITFEDLDTLERHTFKMSEKVFDQIVEDDIGYLTYQRKRFHSFQRDELAQYFEDTNDKLTVL
jgi:hypothetical protein